MVTPGVRKSRNVIKTPGGDAGTRRSTRVKYLVDRLRYDGFSAHHYAYMVKILEELANLLQGSSWKEKLGGSHG